MTRNLLNSESHVALDSNQAYQLASLHALCIYRSNSIFTFIPKNGCSTMRLSIALANGAISDICEYNWIHSNNSTFNPSLREINTAEYTFTILRCPFRRLASTYLDKIVERRPDSWSYLSARKRDIDISQITFDVFVRSLSYQSILRSNHHWRKQVDFLIYKKYDDYFSLENFSEAIVTIQDKSDINIQDARNFTKHGTDQLEKISGSNFSKTRPLQLLILKNQGKVPDYSSMYSDELIKLVKNIYADDINLYKKYFNKSQLLFE